MQLEKVIGQRWKELPKLEKDALIEKAQVDQHRLLAEGGVSSVPTKPKKKKAPAFGPDGPAAGQGVGERVEVTAPRERDGRTGLERGVDEDDRRVRRARPRLSAEVARDQPEQGPAVVGGEQPDVAGAEVLDVSGAPMVLDAMSLVELRRQVMRAVPESLPDAP
jgi:hypothetical protein